MYVSGTRDLHGTIEVNLPPGLGHSSGWAQAWNGCVISVGGFHEYSSNKQESFLFLRLPALMIG